MYITKKQNKMTPVMTPKLKRYDVITDLIRLTKIVNISKTKKDISKRKTPLFWILNGLSNKQKLYKQTVIATKTETYFNN